MIEKIKAWRTDTPGCVQRIHLNNAGAALMPRPVLEAVRAHLSLENQIGGYEAAAMQKQSLNEFYTEIASLLQCSERNVAHATSATDAYNRALTSIPFEAGDVILTTQDDYVSNQIAFLNLQKRLKVQIVWSKVSPAGGMDFEDFEQKLKKYKPKLVAVTHMPTNSGLVQDVVAAGKICKDSGAWYLVDACQTAGQMPLNVANIGCDFLTATFRKFLRGPRGIGFLYASDRVLDAGLEPMFPDLHGALWTDDEEYELRNDAQRFEVWERSYALVAGAREAAAYANKVGLDNIQNRVSSLASNLRQQLRAVDGIRVLDEGTTLGGIVTVGLSKKIDPNDLVSKLRDHRLNTSATFREYARFDLGRKNAPWVLRFSPHYYNSERELEKAVKLLQKTIA